MASATEEVAHGPAAEQAAGGQGVVEERVEQDVDVGLVLEEPIAGQAVGDEFASVGPHAEAVAGSVIAIAELAVEKPDAHGAVTAEATGDAADAGGETPSLEEPYASDVASGGPTGKAPEAEDEEALRRPLFAGDISAEEDDDAEHARFWQESGQELESLQAQVRQKTREAKALLEVADKLNAEAADARQKRANLEFESPGERQLLLSAVWKQSNPAPKLSRPDSPCATRRNRRGPMNPCYQSAEERQRAGRMLSVQRHAKQLGELAEKRETEAAKAAELSRKRMAIVEEAVAVLAEEDAPGRSAEIVAVTGGVAAAAAPAVEPVEGPEAGMFEAIAARQRLITATGVKKRGRPPLTLEEKAAKVKAKKKRLLPEDRDNMQTPGASVRKAILERLDALAVACEDNTTDELWAIAKRFSRPEERAKLATYLEAHGMERERRGKQRCWKRFQSDDTGSKKKTYKTTFKGLYNYVWAWKDRQEEIGFALTREDLVDRFELELESAISDLLAKQSD